MADFCSWNRCNMMSASTAYTLKLYPSSTSIGHQDIISHLIIERMDIIIKMVLFPKALMVVGVGAMLMAIPPVRRRLDDKVLRHVRNYNNGLDNSNKFVTQEEFVVMLKNVGKGMLTIYKAD